MLQNPLNTENGKKTTKSLGNITCRDHKCLETGETKSFKYRKVSRSRKNYNISCLETEETAAATGHQITFKRCLEEVITIWDSDWEIAYEGDTQGGWCYASLLWNHLSLLFKIYCTSEYDDFTFSFDRYGTDSRPHPDSVSYEGTKQPSSGVLCKQSLSVVGWPLIVVASPLQAICQYLSHHHFTQILCCICTVTFFHFVLFIGIGFTSIS